MMRVRREIAQETLYMNAAEPGVPEVYDRRNEVRKGYRDLSARDHEEQSRTLKVH